MSGRKEKELENWSDGLRLVEGSYSLRLGESIGTMKKNKNRWYHKPIVWNDAVGFYARRVMSYMTITPILQHSNNLSPHYSITPILQVLLTYSFDKEGMTAVYQQR